VRRWRLANQGRFVICFLEPEDAVHVIDTAAFVVRSYEPADAPALARNANDRGVWRNLRDAFPHPYTPADAEAFIARAIVQEPQTNFCIAVDGGAVGGIGFKPHQDVERFSAEIGYWLARAHRGKGIATAALRAVCAHAFEVHGLNRLYATPYAWNPASCRVLEKAGFEREGILRCAAFKDGQVVDQILYAKIRSAARFRAGDTAPAP